MRLLTFEAADELHLGALLPDDRVLDLSAAVPNEPDCRSMLALIEAGDAGRAIAARAIAGATDGAKAEHVRPLDAVALRAPIPRPRKNVFCVGLNYRSHVEMNAAALGIRPDIPELPLFFTKPPTAVIGPGAPIHHDARVTQKLDYEVELGVVIGRGGTWIAEADALDHVFGLTLVDEVSARDVQWRSSQMFIGKGLDTYCPMGPWITTRDEAGDGDAITLTCSVNGEERQRDSTAELIFGLPRIIAELSKGLTLEPGDIISTGTPGGCGYQLVPPRFLGPGDVVECAGDGLGRLSNTVIAWPPAEEATR